MDICEEHGIPPHMVIVDHNNEETVEGTLDRGFWAALTIYPYSKMGNERMVEIVRRYGSKGIFINSAADWGISDPLAVPKTAALMREKGIPEAHIIDVCYRNALQAFLPSGQIQASDWMDQDGLDQREKFLGNSILRGGQKPKVGRESGNIVIN